VAAGPSRHLTTIGRSGLPKPSGVNRASSTAAGRLLIVGGFCEAVGVTDRQPPRSLLGDDQLPASAVVANCAMNWERQLTGVYSYTRELGFNPTRVTRPPRPQPRARWRSQQDESFLPWAPTSTDGSVACPPAVGRGFGLQVVADLIDVVVTVQAGQRIGAVVDEPVAVSEARRARRQLGQQCRYLGDFVPGSVGWRVWLTGCPGSG